MIHHVVDTPIQLHGSLGYSQDTPLARWYTQIRSQRLVDGPDEGHRWTTGRNVIKAFKEHGTTASARGGDLLYPPPLLLRSGGERRFSRECVNRQPGRGHKRLPDPVRRMSPWLP